MNVINITDYDNSANDYNISNDCTNNVNNNDLIITTPLLTIPCGFSILCLLSLMVYTLKKTFIQ